MYREELSNSTQERANTVLQPTPFRGAAEPDRYAAPRAV
jgi:hypothetical protein